MSGPLYPWTMDPWHQLDPSLQTLSMMDLLDSGWRNFTISSFIYKKYESRKKQKYIFSGIIPFRRDFWRFGGNEWNTKNSLNPGDGMGGGVFKNIYTYLRIKLKIFFSLTFQTRSFSWISEERLQFLLLDASFQVCGKIFFYFFKN